MRQDAEKTESGASFPPFRIGIGYDVHRVEAGRRCVLGGIEIPADFGCVAHSDGDVVAHALADAILGAMALSDIGHFFPPTDPACEGIDSMKILAKSVAEARSRRYAPVNVDITVVAERPKIGKFVVAMREKIAGVLGVPVDRVGIKATTNERLDDVGKGQGIAAHAVCLLMEI
ncbi:MAG: 2-C-methyl-D-erythritol 2,4-cyclodiphosphate synthase [Opitutae bacterium]|nr:2-C-methyl-D-erythritol 2,4-cyclodiphosphate synthase [Opitutae bacterium]